MIVNKYEQMLLGNASRLDAAINSGGKVIQCTLKIVHEADKQAAVNLCRMISRAADLEDKNITNISLVVKDCLVKFYGYKELINICNPKNSNNDFTNELELSLDELLDELNQLVGLHRVKSKVNDLIYFQKIQQLRKSKGLATPKSTLHLAFTGNPGTGKTTVARIVGRIYKQIGLLSKGHFVEVSRTDLIAGYQGQTALKVKEVIDKAKGGVLFIDEAYSITENDHSDSYGRECLTELTKALEDYRDDLVVIVAGYTEPMMKFFGSNPGLKSRFNTFIEFEDYNLDELCEILTRMCKKNDYTLNDQALYEVNSLFQTVTARENEQFANGRFIRNIYEEMVMNHARRVAKIENPTLVELQEIVLSDIPVV